MSLRRVAPSRRALSVALAAAGSALALAACGSSGKPSGGRASSHSQLALAECMRAHGVPSFPDPVKGSGGEGFSISATPGSPTLTVNSITFSGPAFESAVKTCKLFGGGTAPPPISESQKLQLIRFAQCMRRHGVPSYPDPTFPSGGGVSQQSLPDANAPAVRRAAKVCNGDH